MKFCNSSILLISDCVHYEFNGKFYTRNPIFSKQMSAFLGNFGHITIIAPLSKNLFQVDKLAPYNSQIEEKLVFKSSPNVGGSKLKDKVNIIFALFSWLRLFWKCRNHDIIYLRMPNNLNIISFLLYKTLRKNIIITYTGTWCNYPNEAFTYRLQKWYIKRVHTGPAFIYIPNSESLKSYQGRLISSYSPSHSLIDFKSLVFKRNLNIKNFSQIVFLVVGTLSPYKNQIKSIQIFHTLLKRGLKAKLVFAGSITSYKEQLDQYIANHGLNDFVEFKGLLTEDELAQLYNSSHFLLHTPTIEGYGKTIQEGFYFNLPAIITNFTYANYFKSNTDKVFIFDETEDSMKSLLIYVKRYINDLDFRNKISCELEDFLYKHNVDHWVETYMEALNKHYYKNVS